MTPLKQFIKSKGLNAKLYAAYFGGVNGYKVLNRIYNTPERATLNELIAITTLTKERLDRVIRLAMETTIKDSPFCTRTEYKHPRTIVPLKLKRITKEVREAAKKNRVNKFIIDKGYLVKNIERLNVVVGETKNLTLLDCIKIAMSTESNLSEVINYILFGEYSKSLKDTPLFCRKETLEPIPLVLPYNNKAVLKADKEARESIFYEFSKKNL